MHTRPSCTQCITTQCTTTHLYSTTTHLQHYRCPHLSACSTNLYYTPACLFSASMGSTCTTDTAAHSILLHTCTVLLHTYNTTGVHTCLPVLQTCTTHLPACSLPAWAQHAQQTQLYTVYYYTVYHYTPVQYCYTLIILQVYTPVCLFSASMGSRLPMPPRGDFQPEISHRHCRSCVRRLCKQM